MSLETDSRSTNDNKMFSAQVFDGYQELISESIKLAENQPLSSEIVNRYFHQHTVTETTLAVATTGSGSEYQITVVNGSIFTAGDYIHIGNGATETTHPRIISILANVLTLDRRIDLAHEITTPVIKVIIDISATGQVGTLAAPQIYYIEPDVGEVWFIYRILFSMSHDAAGDLGKFGGIAALTNGALLRVQRSGVYHTFTNWKTNGDIKADMYDVEFDARSGGQGLFGTSGRGTFSNTGSVIRLDGSTGDRLEIYIQDDVTTLGFFSIRAQGKVKL